MSRNSSRIPSLRTPDSEGKMSAFKNLRKRVIPTGGNTMYVANFEYRLRGPFFSSLQTIFFADAGRVWSRELIEAGQPVCKLAFERMAQEPDVLYGEDLGSNYQGQQTMLSKHFLPHAPRLAG